MLVVEPEPVVVEPDVLVDEPEDVLLDEWEVVEVAPVDLRLDEAMVPLVWEELLPAEPVGTMTKVLFAPAGTTAAAD